MSADAFKEYSTKEISHMTNIAESTIRKYALLLEKEGWKFLRNQNGYRIFIEKDILLFNEFKNLSKKNLQVDAIAPILVSKYKKGIANVVTDSDETLDTQSVSPDTLKMILEKVDTLVQENEQQKQFNQELLKHLDTQSQYIEKSLEKRDHQFLESIREIQETKLLLAATQEKEKKWWRFWK